jgi:hypothetical protein
MELKEILLTDEEIKSIHTIAYSIAHEDMMGRFSDQNIIRRAYQLSEPNLIKAQCLKLIEWQDELCLEHPFYDIVTGEDIAVHRWECPQCWAELKKQLREE